MASHKGCNSCLQLLPAWNNLRPLYVSEEDHPSGGLDSLRNLLKCSFFSVKPFPLEIVTLMCLIMVVCLTQVQTTNTVHTVLHFSSHSPVITSTIDKPATVVGTEKSPQLQKDEHPSSDVPVRTLLSCDLGDRAISFVAIWLCFGWHRNYTLLSVIPSKKVIHFCPSRSNMLHWLIFSSWQFECYHPLGNVNHFDFILRMIISR